MIQMKGKPEPAGHSSIPVSGILQYETFNLKPIQNTIWEIILFGIN